MIKATESNEYGDTLLHSAKTIQEATLLVSNSADIHARTRYEGLTPLHLQSRANRIDIVNFLLKAGADANARDACGNTPLHLCESAGVARALLAAGADIHAINEIGKTPAMTAYDNYKSQELQNILKEAGEAAAIKSSKTTQLKATNERPFSSFKNHIVATSAQAGGKGAIER